MHMSHMNYVNQCDQQRGVRKCRRNWLSVSIGDSTE